MSTQGTPRPIGTATDDFTEIDLAALRVLPFKTSSLSSWLSRNPSPLLGPSSDRFVLRMLRPAAIAFNELMSRHSGDPSGVEFRAGEAERWAFVLPDASQPSMYRVQVFDPRGFLSHHTEGSLAACVETMVREGYRTEDAGALDRLARTPEWLRGVEVLALVQRLNAGALSFKGFKEAWVDL